MHEPATALHTVDLASLGERLSALRLCDAASLTAVRRSLVQHGQLTALTVFGSRDQLEVLDGFKRAPAARALGWPTLLVRVDAGTPSKRSYACARCMLAHEVVTRKAQGMASRAIARALGVSRNTVKYC